MKIHDKNVAQIVPPHDIVMKTGRQVRSIFGAMLWRGGTVRL
jgi:hypothetical protein